MLAQRNSSVRESTMFPHNVRDVRTRTADLDAGNKQTTTTTKNGLLRCARLEISDLDAKNKQTKKTKQTTTTPKKQKQKNTRKTLKTP